MKLTEKELNEFPIGTIVTVKGEEKYIKIHRISWENIDYKFSKSSKGIIESDVQKVEIPTYTEYIPPKPILDDKEKEYLSYVIKPFRDKIANIHKARHYKVYEFIVIDIPEDSEITFPNFDAGTMYKGMELDREYSLEELRIVR